MGAFPPATECCSHPLTASRPHGPLAKRGITASVLVLLARYQSAVAHIACLIGNSLARYQSTVAHIACLIGNSLARYQSAVAHIACCGSHSCLSHSMFDRQCATPWLGISLLWLT